MVENKGKFVVFSGGGTGGPSVAPLAIAKEYRQLDHEARFLFLGTTPRLEKKLFMKEWQDLGGEYLAWPAGKWRRYFSWRNLFTPCLVIFTFFRAFFYFLKQGPSLVFSAGSFASVPVAWAAHFLGAKVVVHQQDLRPGLANRLMLPIADVVTASFPQSFKGREAMVIGNPSFKEESDGRAESIGDDFNIKAGDFFLFVTGGASGALSLNKLFFKALPLLPETWKIVHQTGEGKDEGAPIRDNYQIRTQISHSSYEALVSRADLILSRAGLGAISAFAASQKAVVLLPMPQSHQEDNANYLKQAEAAVVLEQNSILPEELAKELINLAGDTEKRRKLANNISSIFPAEAAKAGAEIIYRILYENK